MQTTYILNTEELDERIVSSIKAAFPHCQVTITIHDEPDPTQYLLSDPARRERLLRAIDDINQGRNLITPDQTLSA